MTPGFHGKSMVNINVCYQIPIIWIMTRSGEPEIYHLNTAPRIPHQDIQAQGLPDEQVSPRPMLPGEPPDPLFLLPHTLHQGSAPAPTATSAQQTLPSSPPTACGHQPTPPQSGAPLVGEGCLLTQAPKITLKVPKAPGGSGRARSPGQQHWHLSPKPQAKEGACPWGGSSSRNALLRTLDCLGD